MKEYLLQSLRTIPSPVQGRNEVREYLQARILGILQRAGMMIPLAFHGGTALRFLFNAARYSEDLDFTLERTDTRPGNCMPFYRGPILRVATSMICSGISAIRTGLRRIWSC